MLKFVVHAKKKPAVADNNNKNDKKNENEKEKEKKSAPATPIESGLVELKKEEKDRCSASSHTSQDSDLGSMTQDTTSIPDSASLHSSNHHDNCSLQEGSTRDSTRSGGSSRSSLSTSTSDSKGRGGGTLEKTYMLDSQQDSSSGIASDDHNGTNSESSPTLSSSKEHFPRLGQSKPGSGYYSEERRSHPGYSTPHRQQQDTYVQFQSSSSEGQHSHEPVYSKPMTKPKMGFAKYHSSQAPAAGPEPPAQRHHHPQQQQQHPRQYQERPGQHQYQHQHNQNPSSDSYAQIWPPRVEGHPQQDTRHQGQQGYPPPRMEVQGQRPASGQSRYPRAPGPGYPPAASRPPLPTYAQHQLRQREPVPPTQAVGGGKAPPSGPYSPDEDEDEDSEYFIPQGSARTRACVYQETDLDNPHRSREYAEVEERVTPSSPIRHCIRQATAEILSSTVLTNGFLSTSNSDASLHHLSTDDSQTVIPYRKHTAPPPVIPNTSGKQHFDQLPDDVVTRIFSHLKSDELCTCAGVDKRFYALAWDPILWTSIHITNPTLDVDKALKALTKRLSYETPTICVMIERIVLSGCEKLTDRGMLTVANRCPELSYLDVHSCPNITNIALFEVVSKCVNLETLNVSDCGNITTVCLTPEATLQAATYGKQVYLRYLDMTDCFNLEDSGLQILASYCSQLVYLYLRRCTKITDIGVQYVANYCTGLREFSISDCWNVSDFSLRELAKLKSNLRYLSIAKCEKVTDIGIKYIAKNCRRLRYLNVRGCEGVSDDSIILLAVSCSKLRSLDVGKSDITDRSLLALAERCPLLKKVSVKSCEGITDQGIKLLAQHCRHLQQLNVQDCNISVDAYRAVKKCCKRCIIEHTNPGFY